ncbi:hypothetical protein RND71_005754 [Anisodus tanguticus]|uniref:Uncharacterized protein n=1 Tax=Anisodus tanguticus TaxID=243964 RepID=A0AAE1STR4_9SOLA|nr:hypothetical protein RND71_005754 [Anisodus tanguticus]
MAHKLEREKLESDKYKPNKYTHKESVDEHKLQAKYLENLGECTIIRDQDCVQDPDEASLSLVRDFYASWDVKGDPDELESVKDGSKSRH